ncbi:MAG: hypothetical protein FWG65_12770 [Turicibacter sp.]|nr:hypothetical protein [Turicibacter sp.]
MAKKKNDNTEKTGGKRNTYIAESRVYENPADTRNSPFDVVHPVTSMQAIRDGNTGNTLDNILDDLINKLLNAIKDIDLSRLDEFVSSRAAAESIGDPAATDGSVTNGSVNAKLNALLGMLSGGTGGGGINVAVRVQRGTVGGFTQSFNNASVLQNFVNSLRSNRVNITPVNLAKSFLMLTGSQAVTIVGGQQTIGGVAHQAFSIAGAYGNSGLSSPLPSHLTPTGLPSTLRTSDTLVAGFFSNSQLQLPLVSSGSGAVTWNITVYSYSWQVIEFL